ncbi:SRPBCC family protein [Leucobacter edaphi]
MQGTGALRKTAGGADLVVPRSLAMGIDEAWAYVSEPQLTEQWFGPWEGDGRTGGAIRVRMRFEEGFPEMPMKVLACERPHRLSLESVGEHGGWLLELLLEEDGEDTLVTLIHHLDADSLKDAGEIGPGWEFYMDLLVAATEGTEEPTFDMYYPALKNYYLDQDPA